MQQPLMDSRKCILLGSLEAPSFMNYLVVLAILRTLFGRFRINRLMLFLPPHKEQKGAWLQ